MPARTARPVAKKSTAKKVAATKKAATPKKPTWPPPKPEGITEELWAEHLKMAEQLQEAADRHSLCDTFERELSNINKGLTTLKITLPPRKHDLMLTVTLKREFPTSGGTSGYYGRSARITEVAKMAAIAEIKAGLSAIDGLVGVTYYSENVRRPR